MIQGFKHNYTIIKVTNNSKIGYAVALDENNDKYFIKYSSDIDKLISLQKEATYLKLLKLDYYVEILKDTKNVYLILKYINGKKLNYYKFVSTLEKLNIFLSILDKVEYIHNLGIVHADLKPSNILVGKEIFIIDYNYSVILKDNNSSTFATPAYASLEQLLHRPLDFTSDIYSLGIIFFEFITGHKLFQNKTLKEIINETVFGISEQITDYGAYSNNFNSIFKKCINYSKNDRYQSVKELKKDIEKLISLTSMM